jgi:hypothetical protein
MTHKNSHLRAWPVAGNESLFNSPVPEIDSPGWSCVVGIVNFSFDDSTSLYW